MLKIFKLFHIVNEIHCSLKQLIQEQQDCLDDREYLDHLDLLGYNMNPVKVGVQTDLMPKIFKMFLLSIEILLSETTKTGSTETTGPPGPQGPPGPPGPPGISVTEGVNILFYISLKAVVIT